MSEFLYHEPHFIVDILDVSDAVETMHDFLTTLQTELPKNLTIHPDSTLDDLTNLIYGNMLTFMHDCTSYSSLSEFEQHRAQKEIAVYFFETTMKIYKQTSLSG